MHKITLLLALSLGLASHSFATVFLDDTFADGTRTNQNLPTDSAWWGSAALSATTGAMSIPVGGSAIQAITYFTSNTTASAVLTNIGDTLTATITLTLNGVSAANTASGFRIGLFDFAGSGMGRVTKDFNGSNSLGTNVNGYALFQNMGTSFTTLTPMNIMKRTTPADGRLLGTSGDWGTLSSGPGSTNGFGGFSSGTQYILQLTVQRTATNAIAITTSWLNSSSGGTLVASVIDTNATDFKFDGIALRPQDNTTSASTIIFNEVKVELIPANTPPSISLDPQDQSIFVGQTASFSVLAAGSAPLFYQWYYNTNSVLTNATGSTLTLTNAQVSDSGGYSVLVSNSFGSVTSAVAQLTVTVPDPPSIITQPQGQTVLPGASASFTVVAGGSEPLSFQWLFNNAIPVPNGNDSTLTLTNIQPGDAGGYSVVVSNLAGTITSSNAVLIVNTNPVAPVFTSQPSSQIVLVGNTATFTATVLGTTPISFQWSKNNVAILGATSSTLTLTNLQISDDGSYSLTASNNVGGVTSVSAQLTVTPPVPVPLTAYNLTGFAQSTTGGGVIATNDPAYRQVFTPLDLANAVLSANKTAGSVKVIEIMNDLNLGWNEVGAAVQNLASTPFRAHNAPQIHPVLLVTGMSLMDIKSKSGLTIFSANGSTIRHCNFNVKGCSNIIIRNLKFDENWEWDEATKGQYDKNDWDFITIGNGGSVSNIWIDHCTFTKSYDGIVDTKAGSSAFTLSWCKYTGDDGATNPNSFVWQQINALESNKASYAFYNFLRSNGFSTTDIVTVIQGHDKTHLAGSNNLDPDNATLSMTFHHLWLINVWDRCVPRLRAGNVHDYNLYVDENVLLAAKQLRNARAAAMSTANQNTLNNTYSINPPMNGAISTESGALLVEKSVYLECITPLRNNQTDPSNPAYTGKILALDTIYQKNGVVTRGNSTDPGSQLGPFQAPIIAFSWNLPGNQLPYTYNMDDPAQLQSIVTSPTAGAGAGVLTWNKTNWMVTAYAPSAPVVVADPQSQSASLGSTVTLVVVAGGSAPLSYQWYFNTNTPVANATNSLLTLTNVQATNAGIYSVIVSNSVGSTNSAGATLTVNVPTDPFASWQSQYFGCTNCANAAPDADPFGKGMSNTNQFLAGLNPTNPASAFRIISAVRQGSDLLITWTTAGAHTNAVQATVGDGNGGYTTNFADISGPVIITGNGDALTNYTDAGGATNGPSRYYRVRLVP